MLKPGSEFRITQTLHTLLSDQEHWENMEKIISDSVSYPLEYLPETMRKEDLEHMIKRGNHKSSILEENTA